MMSVAITWPISLLQKKYLIGGSTLVYDANSLGNWGGNNSFLLGPHVTSISDTIVAPLFPLCQFCGGQWQKLDGINCPGHFVSLIVQCLVRGRCFLVGVNLRIVDLHTLYPHPHVHPHTKISHQAHPNWKCIPTHLLRKRRAGNIWRIAVMTTTVCMYYTRLEGSQGMLFL